MTRLGETIKSPWLKVEDLPGQENGLLDLTIKSAKMDTFRDGRPTLTLTFHEHRKPFGCNVTNRKRLKLQFGDIELEQLIGQRIRIHAEMTQDMEGDPCWGCRILPVPNSISQASAAAREQIGASMAAQGVSPGQPAPIPPSIPHSDHPPAYPAAEFQRPMGVPAPAGVVMAPHAVAPPPATPTPLPPDARQYDPRYGQHPPPPAQGPAPAFPDDLPLAPDVAPEPPHVIDPDDPGPF